MKVELESIKEQQQTSSDSGENVKHVVVEETFETIFSEM
jgi:hypothetical protein